MDAPASTLPPPDEPPPYIYGATDIRPRQAREIELCEQASHFDWMYTGTFVLGFAASVYVDIGPLKQQGEPGLRLFGGGLVGFSWGGLLSGGYLSLPKCDPLFSGGPPPEGNVRLDWPIATAIALLSGVTAPIMDYTFLGAVKPSWAIWERSARVFIDGGIGVLGSLFPYLLPPRTWSARKQIDRMHVEGSPGGASLSYRLTF